MKNTIKDEWNKYLFQIEKEYSIEEMVDVIWSMFCYLKTNRMRFDITMLTDPKRFANMYLLSNEEIQTYLRYFKDKQFDDESAMKIVNCMGIVYHMLDISLDEARHFADYTSQNRITLTKGIKDKFDVDLNEINLFLEEVMEKNVVFCFEQAIKCGKEIFKDIEVMLKNKQ